MIYAKEIINSGKTYTYKVETFPSPFTKTEVQEWCLHLVNNKLVILNRDELNKTIPIGQRLKFISECIDNHKSPIYN